MNNKNILYKTVGLTLIVVVALLGLYFLPKITIGDTPLRKVDMLSDVKALPYDVQPSLIEEESLGDIVATEGGADNATSSSAGNAKGAANKSNKQTSASDSASGNRVARQKHRTDSVYTFPDTFAGAGVANIPAEVPGSSSIEDFGGQMGKFRSALHEAGSRPVRIAYIGDSYIEGDILTSELRNLLQSKYGGRGVGFLDIIAVTSKFRATVRQRCAGWTCHGPNQDYRNGWNGAMAGVNGRYFVPNGTATVNVEAQKSMYGDKLGSADRMIVYYSGDEGTQVMGSINKGEHVAMNHLASSHGISAVSLDGNITSFELKVTGGANSRFYGLAYENKTGICVDNLSMRGSDGSYLAKISPNNLAGFNAIRPYDLIIVHFGLNVASPGRKDYSNYIDKMKGAINNLRHSFPRASILVVSVADRDKKDEYGNLKTMPGVRELVRDQRKLAATQGVAFWNLYNAMGGDGSVARMAQNKQANLDYTHINYAGGKVLGKLMYDALVGGK